MKFSCIPSGLAVAAALVLSSFGAFAGEPHALSESEMSAVYGQGLSEPALHALGAMSTQDQSNSGVSSAAAADALAGLAAMSGDVQNLDRELAQQRLQNAATGLQVTLKITQTMLAVDKSLTPIASNVAMPVLGMPVLFMLPALPALDAIQNKH